MYRHGYQQQYQQPPNWEHSPQYQSWLRYQAEQEQYRSNVKNIKLTVILLLVAGYLLHVLGVFTLFLVIGIFPLFIGFFAVLAAFILICFL